MVEEPACEIPLVSGPEAGGGRGVSAEVVWAERASDSLARGLHDGPLNSGVAERIATFPDPQPAAEDVASRTGVVLLADHELSPPEKDWAGQGEVNRDRLVEISWHGPFVRRP